MTSKQKYFKTAIEAEKAAQKDYCKSSLTTTGQLGGPECPPTYRGDGRFIYPKIPQKQLKR